MEIMLQCGKGEDMGIQARLYSQFCIMLFYRGVNRQYNFTTIPLR